MQYLMRAGVIKATNKQHHSCIMGAQDFPREEMGRGKRRETKGESQKGIRYRYRDKIQERRVIGSSVDKIIGKLQNLLEKILGLKH